MCWYYDFNARFLSGLGPQPSLKTLFANFGKQDEKKEGGGARLPTGYGVVFYFFSRTPHDAIDFMRMAQDVHTLLTTAQNEIVIVAATQDRKAGTPRRNNPSDWETISTAYKHRACVVQFDFYIENRRVKWHADNRNAFAEICSVLRGVDMAKDLEAALKVTDP